MYKVAEPFKCFRKKNTILNKIKLKRGQNSLNNWRIVYVIELDQYFDHIHRGSYKSAHVLLNLLNELGKRDKMRGSFFHKEFNKFSNTGAWMLDSIYPDDIKITLKFTFLAWKHQNFVIMYATLLWMSLHVHNVTTYSVFLQDQNFWGSLMTPCLKIWGSLANLEGQNFF